MGWLWGEAPQPGDLPTCPGINEGACSMGTVGGQISPGASCPPCQNKVRKWKCDQAGTIIACCDYYTCVSSSTASSSKNNPCPVA